MHLQAVGGQDYLNALGEKAIPSGSPTFRPDDVIWSDLGKRIPLTENARIKGDHHHHNPAVAREKGKGPVGLGLHESFGRTKNPGSRGCSDTSRRPSEVEHSKHSKQSN